MITVMDDESFILPSGTRKSSYDCKSQVATKNHSTQKTINQPTMVKNLYIIIFLHLFVLVSSSSHNHGHATKYIVTNNVPNTPGGQVFETEIGVNFTLQIMQDITQFIHRIFEQTTPQQSRNVPVLNVYISDFNNSMAYKNDDNINISGPGLDKYFLPRTSSKFYFTSIMYHEMTHVYQWHGEFTAPGGLTEGIADYIMVKSNIYLKNLYTRPGVGKRWDEGYGVTERFLEYCDSLRPGFTADLNNKMRYEYSDYYFEELLGKNLDQLWRDYKAKYPEANRPDCDDASPKWATHKSTLYFAYRLIFLLIIFSLQA